MDRNYLLLIFLSLITTTLAIPDISIVGHFEGFSIGFLIAFISNMIHVRKTSFKLDVVD